MCILHAYIHFTCIYVYLCVLTCILTVACVGNIYKRVEWHVGTHGKAWIGVKVTRASANSRANAGDPKWDQAGSGVQGLSIGLGIKVSWTLSIYLSIKYQPVQTNLYGDMRECMGYMETGLIHGGKMEPT